MKNFEIVISNQLKFIVYATRSLVESCMTWLKTETLILNWKLGKDDDKNYPKSIATVGDFKIKNVKDFKYLGAKLQYDDSSTGETEIENRITGATCKFYELKTFFQNHSIALSTRLSYLESLVRSKLVYGCQSWCLTKKQTEKLDAIYIGFQRMMVRGGSQRLEKETYTRKDGSEGEFSKFRLSKEQIVDICKRGKLSDFIHKQQQNWIGHCIRASDKNFIKQLTFLDYFKSEKKKTGVTDSTYRQVLLRYKENNKTETEKDMIKKMKIRKI